MDESANRYLRGIVEALLFISEKPVMLEQIKGVVEGVTTQEVREIINELKKEYSERKCGISIVEIAGGYQMLSNPDYAMYVKRFYRTKRKEKLSKPALETLAIVAYKHPVTRLDVELIRGVNSDGVIAHLLEKGLIKIAGRKDIPGRPYLYGITKQFLEYFGLKSLEDLPKLEDFSSLQPSEGEEAVEDEPVENDQKNEGVPKQENNAPEQGDKYESSKT